MRERENNQSFGGWEKEVAVVKGRRIVKVFNKASTSARRSESECIKSLKDLNYADKTHIILVTKEGGINKPLGDMFTLFEIEDSIEWGGRTMCWISDTWDPWKRRQLKVKDFLAD